MLFLGVLPFIDQIDVLGGLAIGAASSYILCKPYKGLHPELEVGANDFGIELEASWPR